ncbi:hypothetical protein MCERE19_02283 [Spirosomataceae bacterium]|jgi:antitoxin component HigA of HigAB toxin-antitoxin module
MITQKAESILSNIFKNNRLAMQDALGISKAKLSIILKGEQTFTIEAIKQLMVKYKIDPTWLWDEDPLSEITYMSEQRNEPKYYEAVEKINQLQEELIKYQKKDIESLKRS